MKKEVRLFNDDFDIKITSFKGLKFLEYEEEDTEKNENNLEIKGTDGILPGPMTFGPFPLVLRFSYYAVDIKDFNLMISKLREIINQRKPYYVWHSDMPGKKYAVLPSGMSVENLTGKLGTFEMTFSVIKGYSESYLSTDDMKLSNLNDWQFGNGYLAFDETDDFHHRTKKFRIYNGSSDAIDPTLRHTLNITVHANAPKGFKIRSLTTGDVFEYTGSLVYTDTFMLKGVYPVKNGSRVGVNTNMSWLTLDKGFNYFVVEGEGLSDFDIVFSFNFIYR